MGARFLYRLIGFAGIACAPLAAQMFNPNQIRPTDNNGWQIVTTGCPSACVTQWQAPPSGRTIHTSDYPGIDGTCATDSTVGINTMEAEAQANGESIYWDSGCYAHNNLIYDTDVPNFGAGSEAVEIRSTAPISTYNLSAWSSDGSGNYTLTISGTTPQIFSGAWETLGYRVTISGITGYAGSCNPNGIQWATNVVYSGGNTTMNVACAGGTAASGTSGTVSNTYPNTAFFMQGAGAELRDVSLTSTWTGGRAGAPGGTSSLLLNYASYFAVDHVTMNGYTGSNPNGLASAGVWTGSPSISPTGWNAGDQCTMSGGIGGVVNIVTAPGGVPATFSIASPGQGFYSYPTLTAPYAAPGTCTAISPSTGTGLKLDISTNGGSGGYQCIGCHDGTETTSFVENSNADSFYHSGCAYNIVSANNRAHNGGDDLFSNDSYSTDSCPSHNITYTGDDGDVGAERCMEVGGGYDIHFVGGSCTSLQTSGIFFDSGSVGSYTFDSVSNVSAVGVREDGIDLSQQVSAAGVYIGQESASTYSTNGVLASGIIGMNEYGNGVTLGDGNGITTARVSNITLADLNLTGAGTTNRTNGLALNGSTDVAGTNLTLGGFTQYGVSALTGYNSGYLTLHTVNLTGNNTQNYGAAAMAFGDAGFSNYSLGDINESDTSTALYALPFIGNAQFGGTGTVTLSGFNGCTGSTAVLTIASSAVTGVSITAPGTCSSHASPTSAACATTSGGATCTTPVTVVSQLSGGLTSLMSFGSASTPAVSLNNYSWANGSLTAASAVILGTALPSTPIVYPAFPFGISTPLEVNNAQAPGAGVDVFVDDLQGVAAATTYGHNHAGNYSVGVNSSHNFGITDLGYGMGIVTTATYLYGGQFTGSGPCTLGAFNDSSTATGTILVTSGVPSTITLTSGGTGATAPPTQVTQVDNCTGGAHWVSGNIIISSTFYNSNPLSVDYATGTTTLGESNNAGVALRGPVTAPYIAPASGGPNCLQIAAVSGAVTQTGSPCSGGTGLSGMTPGQVPIAATATTVTSSKALAGSGAGIVTGPTTSTANDCAKFNDATGTLADSGAACGSGGGITTQTNGTNNSSQTTLNLINSSANAAGLTLTQTNTTGGTVQGEVAGTVNTAHGGTGVSSTFSGLREANGASADTAATAAQVVGVIGTTAVTNATNATNVAGGVADEIHVQTGPGTTSFIPNGITGQTLCFTYGVLPAPCSGGIALGNGGAAITATTYTVQCDSSTSLLDRGTELKYTGTTASTWTIPDPGTSGCGNNLTIIVGDAGTGVITVQRQTSATFTVINGTTVANSQTSFTLNPGQFASINSGDNTNWDARVTYALAAQAANTVLANTSASSATPTAVSIPSGIQNYVPGSGWNQATGHQIQAPLACPDSSGSGTAQACSTGGTTYTPAAYDCIIYSTTTANTGTGLTVNVDSLGAKPVAIAGSSGWTTTLTAGIIPAAKPLPMCYDGTNWDVAQTGTASIPISTGVSGLGTGVAAALAVNTGSAGAPGVLLATGTAAMGTGAITSGSCATVVTVSATGVATTDVIETGFNGDPTAVTGYGASSTGAVLTIYPYPSSGNVNFKVCNSTSASITPGALTLNWKVYR